jgi:RNA polymerase sigma-70 factor (ECF subfamily)
VSLYADEQRRGGDDVANRLNRDDIARLYADHGAWLLGYACSLVRDRSTAEDAVHQLFARLLRGDIAITGSPVAYCCRALRNGVMNHARAKSHEVELDDARASWLEAPRGLEEMGLAIEAGLRRLPTEQREVIVLRVWGQLSFQEIADALEIPSNTVASRYRYGLVKLRDILKPLGVD